MTTGQRMKERRKEIGLSAETLAEELGLSPATIYRYENGYIDKVPGDRLAPIAKALRTTPAYLMGWTDDELEPTPEIKISQEASRKLDALLAMVNELTDDEWSKLMDYCELLVFSRKNRKDE